MYRYYQVGSVFFSISFAFLHVYNKSMSVSTKDLQIARRNAKRTRASKACVRCKSSKTQCSDYRPCKRCKNTGLGGSCIDNDANESAAYRFENACPTPSPAREMISIIQEPNTTSMGTKDYNRKSSQQSRYGLQKKPESVPHSAELAPSAKASDLSFAMSVRANAVLQQTFARSVRLSTDVSMPHFNDVQGPSPPLSALMRAAFMSALPSSSNGAAEFSGTPNISSLDFSPNQNTNFHTLSAPSIPTTLLSQQAAGQRVFQSPADLLAIDRLRLLLALTTSGPPHPTSLPSLPWHSPGWR